MPLHQLAQVNIALAREPLGAPLLADFVEALEPVNARADQAAGFVWRMQDADGNATAVRGFDENPRLIINMSVWESLDLLRAFVDSDPAHLRVMRRRREWFHRRELGPTPAAFTFRMSFDSPAATVERVDDRELCPA